MEEVTEWATFYPKRSGKGRILMAWLMIVKQMMCVMSVYGPQTGRTEAEKEEFMDALERLMGLLELEVMLCMAGDFNAHVGVVEPGEEESVGRYGWGERNMEGRTLVALVARNGLAVASSFFQKRERVTRSHTGVESASQN